MSTGFFERMVAATEAAYLASEDPRRQSGFSGTEERWLTLRKPVADCVDRPGSFLDVGCANGYLVECVVRWCAERGLAIEPYGIDLSPRLVDLARSRLPALREHFEVGNALQHMPSRTYDFARTELLYVPTHEQRCYLRHLLDHVVAPGGRLLVANYLEGSDDVAGRFVEGCEPVTAILPHLVSLGFVPSSHRDGFDPIKGRRVRIAIVSSHR